MRNIEIDYIQFRKHLLAIRNEKSFRFFYDIETLQYNEEEGRKKPTLYKNVVYSVAISYFLNDGLYIVIFPNFKDFFDIIINTYSRWKNVVDIQLIAHNNNKYDNHFLRNDLIYYYDIKYTNLYLNNAVEEGNLYSTKLKDISNEDKQYGIILERRIKSRNNMEIIFFLDGVKFTTIDNIMKTNVSVKVLGEKLKRLGVITDDELKTDYNYTEYNKDYDMSEEQARKYALNVFKSLDETKLTYIRNDVILLAKSVMYYSDIFEGFDYSKITFTSNILESYNTNELTSFQLLRRVGEGGSRVQINYTDYKFSNQNYYDFLKTFYAGGLNLYNYKFLGQVVDEPCFGIDIHSSYPYVMHNFRIPTFLNSYEEFETPTKVNIKEIESKEYQYTLYRISKSEFDFKIVTRIKSRVIKNLLVKYYGKHDFININSYTIKMIENITDLKINELNVYSYITYNCVYFGSRDKLEDYYIIKTQAKENKKLNFDSLYNIYRTDEDNSLLYSNEEVENSKVNLNGLYGIPALRPYFNLFRWRGGELQNVENGFVNSQRNILFSIFVTSVSLYNLLNPFKYLTHEEIDDNFLYCDTDSLYFKKKIFNKLGKELFHDYNLGQWDIQNETIDKFYVLNHKKYAYLENGKITVKAGGIPQQAFNTNMEFEDFIDTQFSDGKTIENTKSIYTLQGNIAIYPSKTKLEVGYPYRTFTDNEHYDNLKEQMFEEIKKEIEEDYDGDDTLYIESNLGTFSINEIYPIKHDIDNKLHLIYMEFKEDLVKKILDNNK